MAKQIFACVLFFAKVQDKLQLNNRISTKIKKLIFFKFTTKLLLIMILFLSTA